MNVSQATRAKMLYMLTGKMQAPKTIVGYDIIPNSDGTQTIKTYAEDGDIVTCKTLKGKEADRYVNDVKRQQELNILEVGEQRQTNVYSQAYNNYAFEAIRDMNQGGDPKVVFGQYLAASMGIDKSAHGKKLVKDVDKYIKEHYAEDLRKLTTDSYREEIKNKTGIDVYDAFKKDADKRTDEDNDAIAKYYKKLFNSVLTDPKHPLYEYVNTVSRDNGRTARIYKARHEFLPDDERVDIYKRNKEAEDVIKTIETPDAYWPTWEDGAVELYGMSAEDLFDIADRYERDHEGLISDGVAEALREYATTREEIKSMREYYFEQSKLLEDSINYTCDVIRNKETGGFLKVQLFAAEGEQPIEGFVLSGKLSFNEDGTIDKDNCDDTITIRYKGKDGTFKVEMFHPDKIEKKVWEGEFEQSKQAWLQSSLAEFYTEHSFYLTGIKPDKVTGQNAEQPQQKTLPKKEPYDVGSKVDINGNKYRIDKIGDGFVSLVAEDGRIYQWSEENLKNAIKNKNAEVLEKEQQTRNAEQPNAEQQAVAPEDGEQGSTEQPQAPVEPIKAGEVVTDGYGNVYTVKEADLDKVVITDADGKDIEYERTWFDDLMNQGEYSRFNEYAQQGTSESQQVPTAQSEGTEQPAQQSTTSDESVAEVGKRFVDPSDGSVITIKSKDNNGVTFVDENGREYTQTLQDFAESLNKKELVREQDFTPTDGEQPTEQAQQPVEQGAEQPQVTEQAQPTQEAQTGVATQGDASEPMPMIEVGAGKNKRQTINWTATTPERGHQYLFGGESPLPEDAATRFVDKQIDNAQKNLDKLKKNGPKDALEIFEYQRNVAEHERQLAEAQKLLDYWNAVKAEHERVKAEEAKAETEEAANQRNVQAGVVSEEIKQKWNDAEKEEGAQDEITLPNGETISGHYVIVESGVPTASHQSTNGFVETEGFPTDENGQTVNDRDYKRDQEAQQVTRQMADSYDQRAVQSPVVVSQDGVVLSGNGRTMAGEIAAMQGTDKKYNDYLRTHAEKFGFTAEKVGRFEHPRLVFVADGETKYDANTFAKFNQREMKSQSKTEKAVKMGKLVDDHLFGRVMDTINNFDSLSQFYADDNATHAVIKQLAESGIIQQTDMADLFDGGKLSEAGQALVESILIGKVFDANPDAVRQITEVKSMRKSVMNALTTIVANNRLGNGYSLAEDLAQAVDLVHKARQNGYKIGDRVSHFAGQGNLFAEDGATVADYKNAAVMMLADVLNDNRMTQLKKVLQSYNERAKEPSEGIADMFTGGLTSKQDIINEINEQLGYARKRQDSSAETTSNEQGGRSSSSEQGTSVGTSNQGGEQGEVKHEEAEPFNNLAVEVKKAKGVKKNEILSQMRDIISNFAKKNGYAEPVFHLTREDFLNAEKPERRAEIEENLNNGFHMPAYYKDGKLHVFVEGCENFGKDVAEALAHESTHADNADFPENVSTLTHAIENEHSVSIDEMLDILYNLSHSDHYEKEYDRLEAKGKNPNEMLADEVIAHTVSRMVTKGEAALDEITNNETIKAVVRRAYKFRENERQRGIRASETERRNSDEISRSVGDSRTENKTTERGQELDGHESTDQGKADTGRTESGRVEEQTDTTQGEHVSVEEYVQNHPDFKEAYEKGSDVMRVWRKKLEAYAAEHFPNEESLEAMMKDPAFAKLYNDAEKADKEERAKVGEVVERLQKEYQEQHAEESNGDETLLDVDGNPIVAKKDDGTVELNYHTWQEEKEQVRKALEDGGLDPDFVDGMMSQADVIAESMKSLFGKYPMFGGYQNKEKGKQPILRNTGEYISWDYSFNCIKKDAINAVIESLVADGKSTHLGITQMEALKSVLQKHGFLTPCVMCYVEAKRKIYKQSKEIADKWNAVAEAADLSTEWIGDKRELTNEQRAILTEFANGKGLDRVNNFTTEDGDGIKADTIKKIAKLMLNSPELCGRMNFENMMSPSSFSKMYNDFAHTGLMDFLTQGQSRGKSLLEAVPFSLDNIPQDLFYEMYNPVKLADLGGLRQFSYEDARAMMFFDYYQQFMVMQGARSLEHLYTKRPFFVEMFGKTGAMMNQSLIVDIFKGADWHKEALGLSDKDYAQWLKENAGFIPRGALAEDNPLYERGSMELVPNYSVESFPVDLAMKNIHNPEYNSCIGNVIVAPNVKFILWALDNPDIHQILAYHANGANPIMKSLTGYDLAEPMDDGYHTKKNGKAIENLSVPEIGLEINGKTLQWNKLLRKNGYDARRAAQVYLDYCKEHGLTPMFCYDGVVDMSGERATSHPNYYKLLTDFRVYDDNGNGIRQRSVKAVIPDNWKDILDKYLNEEQTTGERVKQISMDESLQKEINDITRYASMESNERNTFVKLLTDVYGKDNISVCGSKDFDKMLDEAQGEGTAEMLRNKGGIVYGFAVGDKIVLNEDYFNAHTPMHEHTHIFMKVLQATNPRLYKRGMDLWRDTDLWNKAKQGLEMLGEEPTDEKIFSEVISQFTGNENEKIISKVTGITDKNWLKKAMSWISEMWNGVKSAFSRWTGNQLDDLTAEQFGAMPIRALYDAKEREAYKAKLEQYKKAKGILNGDVEMHSSLDEERRNERTMRDVLVEHLRDKNGMDAFNDDELGQRVLDDANKRGENVRMMAFGEPYDYEKYPRGRVEPNLKNISVRIVDTAGNDKKFSNYAEAKTWAIENLCKVYTNEETGGKGEFSIVPKVINKYVSKAARDKSENEYLHFVVLQNLPSILHDCIDTETHPNFTSHGAKKVEGDFSYDKNTLVHVLYGAVKIGDKLCRVKLTAKEYPDNKPTKPYSFEVTSIDTEIESLDPIDAQARSEMRESNNSISAAKLLKGVEMSYDSGKYLLEESEKRSETIREQRANNVLNDIDSEYMAAVERGDMDTAKKLVETAAKLSGYEYDESWKMSHEAPDASGYYPSLNDISEMMPDIYSENAFRYYGSSSYDSYDTIRTIQSVYGNPEALVKIYRAVPADVKEGSVRNGDWVSLSREYAKDHGISNINGKFRIIEQEVPAKYLYSDGNSIFEMGYDDGKDYNYRNTKNNRKLNDVVTYDDKGNIIPLSKRFNYRNSDVRFFRTKDGEAYGFTIGGKIYIDPRVANSETPIHEYSHLWATAMQKGNPKEWKNIVDLMKGTSIWDEVRKTYPELTDDSAIADEVLAHYSGRRGAERLREKMRAIADGKGSPLDKADAMSALHKVKAALEKFWKGVADFLGIHYTSAEDVADRVMKDLLDGVDPRKYISEEDVDTDSTLRFHKEKDEDTLKKLNSEPTIKVYRAMQVIDGKLYPPMAAKVGKGLVEPNELGEWIRADENPELAIADIDKKTGKQKVDKNGDLKWKFKLDKGGKDALGKKATDVVAAYNPYWHTSRSPLNDQFKSAWIRPNMVVVECEIPESELTSGYKADRAKDSVGEVDWKSGSVSGEVFKQTGNARKVILSRWCKPVRILSDAEVAQKSKEFIGDADVVIPENVLTPKQKIEFEKAGLKIGAPEKGVNKTEQIEEAIKKGLEVDNSLKSDSDGGLLFRDAEDIRLSKQEYAKLMSAINTHQNYKVGRVNGEFLDNNYYLYTAQRNGSFPIKKRIPIVGNEEIINKLQDGIKDGTIRNSRDITSALKGERIVGDGDNSSYVDAQGRPRSNGRLGSLDARTQQNGRRGNEYLGDGVSESSPNELHSRGRIEYTDENAAKVAESILDYDIPYSVEHLKMQFREYDSKDFLDHIMYYVEHKQPRGWAENNKYAIEIIRKCIEARKRELDGKPARYPKSVKDFLREGDGLDHNDSSDKLHAEKRNSATQLSSAMHLDGEVEILETNEGLEGRERTAKGWYDPNTGKIVVVLGNHENAADVQKTIFHEAVAHKGLRAMVGEEKFDGFIDNIYKNADKEIQSRIDELAEKKYKGDKRVATEEYMASLAEDMNFEKPENKSLFAKVKKLIVDLLKEAGVNLGFKLTDNDLRYILWRSHKNLMENGGKRNIFDIAEDARMRERLEQTDGAEKRAEKKREKQKIFRDGNDNLKNVVDGMREAAQKMVADEKDSKKNTIDSLTSSLRELNKAMSAQRAYDLSTVKSVTGLVKTMMDNGLIKGVTDYEQKRMLSIIENVHGKKDTRNYVNKLMDIAVGNMERNASQDFVRLTSMRGQKVDQRGVVVQKGLDPNGQKLASYIREHYGKDEGQIEERMKEVQERMGSNNEAVAESAAIEYQALQMADYYRQFVKNSKENDKQLRKELAETKEKWDSGEIQMTRADFRQYEEEINFALLQNKIGRTQALQELNNRISGDYAESAQRAQEWQAQEKQRVADIQHNANSDLEGVPCRENPIETGWAKITNGDKGVVSNVVPFLMAPQITFANMLEFFGSKNARGRGYLYNRFMHQANVATDNEIVGYRGAIEELDGKAKEMFGGDFTSLMRKANSEKPATVYWYENGENYSHQITVGNMLYIYMVNKMSDGRMKLRKMGISEENVNAIVDKLNDMDPQYVQFADWMQNEFLPSRRNKYNDVHKRMFGTSMPEVEDYFPLKILKSATNQDHGSDAVKSTDKPSTTTGAIKKRTRNSLPLDLLNADAFSVLLGNVKEMEHWAAFAEFNRDLNTLRNYKKFRTKLMNMTSLRFGSGEQLLKNFEDTCDIVCGTYGKNADQITNSEKAAVQVTKYVTAAKIAFRLNTALKQLLSFPAYLSDSNLGYLAQCTVDQYHAWKFAMTLPQFRERFKGRMAGDPMLAPTEADWNGKTDRFFEWFSKWGLSTNAFVDAVTVAVGAHAMYKTRYAKLIKQGYSPEVADERAREFATENFNKSQQSSLPMYMSPLQSGVSWYSRVWSTFRNASMAYARQTFSAMQRLGQKALGGRDNYQTQIEFMTKQYERDGIDHDQAVKNAKSEFWNSIGNDAVRIAVFNSLLAGLWNLGSSQMYLLFGNDDDEKKKLISDAFTQSLWGGIEGLTGGDLWSNFAMNWIKLGRGEAKDLGKNDKDMPAVSDFMQAIGYIGKDNMMALQSCADLLGQTLVGVAPTTVVNVVGSIWNACSGNYADTLEGIILFCKVMNAPKTNMDKLYLKEIDATIKEGKNMSIDEFAKRYADYKLKNKMPLVEFAMSDEDREKSEAKYKNEAINRAKDTINGEFSTDDYKNLVDESKQTGDKLSKINELRYADQDEYNKQMKAIRSTPEFRRHGVVEKQKNLINKAIQKYLREPDPSKRAELMKYINERRDYMVDQSNKVTNMDTSSNGVVPTEVIEIPSE